MGKKRLTEEINNKFDPVEFERFQMEHPLTTGTPEQQQEEDRLFEATQPFNIPGFEPEKYTKYLGDTFNPFDPTIDEQRTRTQPAAAKFLGFLNQAIIGEVVGGSIEGIGYLGELFRNTKQVAEEEGRFGNFVSELGQKLREFTQEATPIYDLHPGEFKPSSFSWWMKNGVSIASTFSLMLPAAGAMRALSYAGKAAKVAKIGKLLNLSDDVIGGISKGANVLGQASFSRHMENMMEAGQTFTTQLDKYRNSGLSEVEARSEAAKSASQVYNRNWALLGQDILQYSLLLGKTKALTKAKATGIVDDVGKKTAAALRKADLTAPTKAKQFSKGALGTLATAITEGSEEAYQYVVGQEAEYLSDYKLGFKGKEKSKFSDRLGEYIKDGEFWTSSFFGAFGGAVFSTAGPALQKWVNKAGITEDDIRAMEVGKRQAKIQHYNEMKIEALESNNLAQIDKINDYLKSDLMTEAAMYGNLGNVIETFENFANMTPEQFKKQFPEYKDTEITPEFIKEKSAEYVTDAKNFQKIFEKTSTEQTSPDLKRLLSHKKFIASKLDQKVGKINTEINDIRRGIPLISEMSGYGNELLDLSVEIASLKQAIKGSETYIKEVKDDTSKGNVEKSKKILEADLKEAETKLAKHKENDNRSAKQKRTDTDILGNTPELQQLTSLNTTKVFTIKGLRDLQREIKEVEADPKGAQQNINVERSKDLIDKQTDPKKLAESMEDLDATDGIDDLLGKKGVTVINEAAKKKLVELEKEQQDAFDNTVKQLIEDDVSPEDIEKVINDSKLQLSPELHKEYIAHRNTYTQRQIDKAEAEKVKQAEAEKNAKQQKLFDEQEQAKTDLEKSKGQINNGEKPVSIFTKGNNVTINYKKVSDQKKASEGKQGVVEGFTEKGLVRVRLNDGKLIQISEKNLEHIIDEGVFDETDETKEADLVGFHDELNLIDETEDDVDNVDDPFVQPSVTHTLTPITDIGVDYGTSSPQDKIYVESNGKLVPSKVPKNTINGQSDGMEFHQKSNPAVGIGTELEVRIVQNDAVKSDPTMSTPLYIYYKDTPIGILNSSKNKNEYERILTKLQEGKKVFITISDKTFGYQNNMLKIENGKIVNHFVSINSLRERHSNNDKGVWSVQDKPLTFIMVGGTQHELTLQMTNNKDAATNMPIFADTIPLEGKTRGQLYVITTNVKGQNTALALSTATLSNTAIDKVVQEIKDNNLNLASEIVANSKVESETDVLENAVKGRTRNDSALLMFSGEYIYYYSPTLKQHIKVKAEAIGQSMIERKQKNNFISILESETEDGRIFNWVVKDKQMIESLDLEADFRAFLTNKKYQINFTQLKLNGPYVSKVTGKEYDTYLDYLDSDNENVERTGASSDSKQAILAVDIYNDNGSAFHSSKLTFGSMRVEGETEVDNTEAIFADNPEVINQLPITEPKAQSGLVDPSLKRKANKTSKFKPIKVDLTEPIETDEVKKYINTLSDEEKSLLLQHTNLKSLDDVSAQFGNIPDVEKIKTIERLIKCG